MGKKARIRRYPQKYGRKYDRHPYHQASANLKKVEEEVKADGVITPEETAQVEEARQQVVDSVVAAVTKEIEEKIKPVVEKVEQATKEARKTLDSISIDPPKKKKTPTKRTSTKRVAKKKVSKG